MKLTNCFILLAQKHFKRLVDSDVSETLPYKKQISEYKNGRLADASLSLSPLSESRGQEDGYVKVTRA